MANFAYQAIAPNGRQTRGEIDAPTRAHAVAQIRRLGVMPVDVIERPASAVAAPTRRQRIGGKARAAVTKTFGELATLLGAGLPLDRAVALTIENIGHAGVRAEFVRLLGAIKQGQPLSSAMAEAPALFPPMAQAMAEAGEANGALGPALGRLAAAMQQADDLRALITTAMIYPVILVVIAVSVILMMLLFVVPQFDALFVGAGTALPPESRFVLDLSRGLRTQGWLILGLAIGVGGVVWASLRQPAARAWRDRIVLRLPQLGTLVQHIETARFALTLGALVDGGVTLPSALVVAQRTISNVVMARAVSSVASSVKQGGGLTAPLAETGVFPRIALGFLRTGEEISQLALMLDRLSDVLDRDVKIRLQRIIGVVTPLITIILGAAVAAIIAAIMSAILGFNDVAVS